MDADIVIVGAGLVGLTAAIAMSQQGRKVVVVDAKQPTITKSVDWDARIYALTIKSQQWLNRIGVWPLVDMARVNRIQGMQLWTEHHQQALMLDADDANLNQLGCIIENQNVMHACWQQLQTLDVELISEQLSHSISDCDDGVVLTLSNGQAITAKLLIGADGSQSWVRQQRQISCTLNDFEQTALVVNYQAEHSHANMASQWFAEHETLALLPLPEHKVSMVWSLPTQRAKALMAMTALELAEQVSLRTQHCLGQLTPLNQALGFALKQQTAHPFIARRTVLVGDAAHQVHPMAGQGVNLGFADVMQFASSATKLHALQDIGDVGFLRQYERARKLDVLQMNGLTSGLDKLFASPSISTLASWGMQQINQQLFIKQLLVKQATID